MSQGKSPETKVGSSVGDHTENKLNSFNGLVDKNFAKSVFLVVVLVITMAVGGSFFGKEVGLGTKKNGDGDTSNGKKNVLHTSLSIIHGLVDISRGKGNVDEGSNKVGWLATISGSSKVKRALVNQSIISLAVISPGSTCSISITVTLDPNTSLAIDSLLVVFTSPAVSSRVKARGGKHPRVPVDGPLHKDEDNHVNKEGGRKGNHRKELKKKVQSLAKVNGIETLEAGTGKHLSDTENDRKLHLEGVEKEKFILGHMPNGIETEGVNSASFAISSIVELSHISLLGFLAGKRPTGSKKVESEREAIIVHQTGIHCKESHHGNHVTTRMKTTSQFIQLGLIILLLIPQQVKTCTKQEQSVTNISIHHTKQKGKRGRSEQGWIGFPIPRNTISIHELLIPISKLIRREVGRRRRPRLGHLIHMTGHILIHITVGAIDTHADILKLFGNDPSFSAEHAGNIGLEHVEGMVDGLFAEDNPSPTFSVLGEHLTETESSILVLEEDGTRVHQLLSVFSEHPVNGGGIVHIRKGVTMGEKGIANLLQLGLNGEGFEKDNKDAFFNEGARFGTGDGLLNGCKADVAVSTGGPENHAFESNLFFGGDNSSDGGEAHVHVAGFVIPSREESVRFTGGLASGKFGNSETGGIRHEESARLLENFLQFDLFIVLPGQFLRVSIQLLQLTLVSLQFHLEGFQELGSGGVILVIGGAAGEGTGGGAERGGGFEKSVNFAGGFEGEAEIVAFVAKETELAFEFVAAADVGDVAALEWGQVGVELWS